MYKNMVQINTAIEVLEKAEAVLMKRISRMLDGKPRVAAQSRLAEIKTALRILKSATTK